MAGKARSVVYLSRGEELLVAEAGHALDGEYFVGGITDSAVHIIYTPLGIKQVLTFEAQ
jgi:hypothetical protein